MDEVEEEGYETSTWVKNKRGVREWETHNGEMLVRKDKDVIRYDRGDHICST